MTETPKPPLQLQPLQNVYASHGLPLPAIERIDGADVPEPYKSLLVQNGDMTPTLENFHHCRIHLNVIRKQTKNNRYLREVVLLLDGSEKPVEYGAIEIDLGLFTPEAQQAIVDGQRPLGSILRDFAISHTSHPKAFLRVIADEVIGKALSTGKSSVLYGRENTLYDSKQRSLAEIVEILPL